MGTWKSTTNSFAATPATIPSGTWSRSVPHAMLSPIAGESSPARLSISQNMTANQVSGPPDHMVPNLSYGLTARYNNAESVRRFGGLDPDYFPSLSLIGREIGPLAI